MIVYTMKLGERIKKIITKSYIKMNFETHCTNVSTFLAFIDQERLEKVRVDPLNKAAKHAP